MNYKIADINSEEFNAIKRAENSLREETGKDFVLIAWEKDPKH